MSALPIILHEQYYAEYPQFDDCRPARGASSLEDIIAESRTLFNPNSLDDYWDSQGWVVNDPLAQIGFEASDARKPFGSSKYWDACTMDDPCLDLARMLDRPPAQEQQSAQAKPQKDGMAGLSPTGSCEDRGDVEQAARQRSKHSPPDSAALGSADAAPLLQVWQGGLASRSLGLGAEPGPPQRLEEGAAGRPSLRELYKLDQEIGRGAFGVVRRARHSRSGQACVVKAVSREGGGESRNQIVGEGGLLERLLRMSGEVPHPNITLFLDVLMGPSYYYVVMEELNGPELVQHVADRQPAPEYELQGITRQVLAALAHLHDTVGIYHRDVKLGNFRFRGDPADSALVLLDFGFCGSVSGPYDGVVCGTTVFMAPEVSGRSARPPHLAAMDLWSAGVILYVLLTGEQPFQEHDVRLLGRVGCSGASGAILQRAFEATELGVVSDDAICLLQRLLDVDPSARITAAQALEHDWFL